MTAPSLFINKRTFLPHFFFLKEDFLSTFSPLSISFLSLVYNTRDGGELAIVYFFFTKRRGSSSDFFLPPSPLWRAKTDDVTSRFFNK